MDQKVADGHVRLEAGARRRGMCLLADADVVGAAHLPGYKRRDSIVDV